jgi:hypothetical protein
MTVRVLLALVAALAVAVGTGVGYLVVAMRTGSPRLLRPVRRFNRAVTNRLQARSAGRAGASTSLIRHRGRTTGREYETPIVVFPTAAAADDDDGGDGGGFLVSLPYGPGADWVRNVLAAGSATLVTDGRTLTVDRPEVVATDEVRDRFPPGEQRTQRWFRVEHCLRLHGGAR